MTLTINEFIEIVKKWSIENDAGEVIYCTSDSKMSIACANNFILDAAKVKWSRVEEDGELTPIEPNLQHIDLEKIKRDMNEQLRGSIIRTFFEYAKVVPFAISQIHIDLTIQEALDLLNPMLESQKEW